MTISPDLAARFYDQTSQTLRTQIAQAAQLTADRLDAAATELEVDLQIHLFNAVNDPHVQAFSDAYAAFVAMMEDGFAMVPWPEGLDSSLKELQEYQYFLAWAWHENNVAHYLLCSDAAGWEPQEAKKAGLAAALSAQRAYFHALGMLMS